MYDIKIVYICVCVPVLLFDLYILYHPCLSDVVLGCMCVVVDYFNPKEEEKRTRREIQYSRTFEMFS